MARVAVAFVEVRPDLDLFAAELRTKLEAIHESINVGVHVDTSQLGAVKAAVTTASQRAEAATARLNQRIEADQQRHAARMQAINDDMLRHEMDTLLREERHVQSERIRTEAGRTQVNRRIEAEEERHAARMRRINDDMFRHEMDALLREERHGQSERFKLIAAANNRRLQLERAGTAARIAQRRAEASRLVLIARDETKRRLRVINEAAKERLKVERAHAALAGRIAAEDFIRNHVDVVRRQRGRIAEQEARALEQVMLTRFGIVGQKTAQRFIREFNRDIDKEMRGSGARAGDSFAKNLTDQLTLGVNLRLGQLAPVLALVAVTAAPLSQLISDLAASATALASAALRAATALGVAFLSSLIAVGQAASAAAIGLSGFADALKSMTVIQQRMAAGIEVTQGEIDNFHIAMAQLSPAAQTVVTALGKVHGQFINIRKSLQQALFAGMGKQIETLAAQYLPLLQMRLRGTADILNQTAQAFGAWAKQPRVIAMVSDVMAGNNRIVRSLLQALVPLADVALRLVKAFQPLGQLLARYVTSWAFALDKTIAARQASGQLATMVGNLEKALSQLFRIARNIGGALRNVFEATLPAGQILMNMFERLTRRWEQWSGSITGQNALNDWAMASIPTMAALGKLIGDIFRMFAQLSASGDIANLITQLSGLTVPLGEFLHQLSAGGVAAKFVAAVTQVTRALNKLSAGKVIGNMIVVFGNMVTSVADAALAFPPLTRAITGVITALALLAAVRLTATLSGLAQIPMLTAAFIRFGKAVKGVEMSAAAAEMTSAKLGRALRAAGAAVATFSRALVGMQLAEAAATTNAAKFGTAIKNVALWIGRSTVAAVRFIAVNVIARAASWAWAAATAAVTAAQWNLNAAMAANPAGIIIAAIVATLAVLIGLFVVLYKNSKDFRDIVAAIGELWQRGFSIAVTWISGLVRWIVQAAKTTRQWWQEWLGHFAIIRGLRAEFKLLTDQISKSIGFWKRFFGIQDPAAIDDTTGSMEDQAAQMAKNDAALARNEERLQSMKDAQDQLAEAYRNLSSVTAESAQLDAQHIDALARKHKLTTGSISAAWSELANSYIGQEKQRALATAKATVEILKLQKKQLEGQISVLMATGGEDTAAYHRASNALANLGAQLDAANGQYKSLSNAMDALLVKAAKNGAGIANAYGNAANATAKAAGAVQAAVDKIDPFLFIKEGRGAPYPKLAFDTGKELANYLAKGITSGAKNIAKASALIQRSYGASLRKMLATSQAFWDKSRELGAALPTEFAAKVRSFATGDQLDAYLGAMQDSFQTLLDQIKDFKQKAIDALTSGANLVNYFGFIPTPHEVQWRLNTMLDQVKNFTSKLAALQEKGLSKELAAAWLQAGYDTAGNLVEGLQAATPEEIANINKTFAEIGTTAQTATDTAANKFFNIGQQTVQGYVDGIQSMRDLASKEMAALIDAVIAAAKKKLKIKSPAQAIVPLGVNTMLGYIEGVSRMRGATVDSVNGILDAVTRSSAPGLALPTANGPRYANVGTAGLATTPPQVNVRVFIGDTELTDIVATQVEYHDTNQARALLSGRRGG